MFGVFTEFLETASQKAKEYSDAGMDLIQKNGYLPQLEKGYNVDDDEGERNSSQSVAAKCDASNAPSASSTHISMNDNNPPAGGPDGELPWEHVATFVPPQLQAYSAEWHEFLSGIVAEENTFCVPLHVYLDDAAAMDRLEAICGVTADKLRGIIEQIDHHEMGAKAMIDILEKFPDARQVRFQVVPKYTVEDKFWKHLMGRCRVYHQCPSISAALDAMDILHKEPRLVGHHTEHHHSSSEGDASKAARKHGYGSTLNASTLQEIRDKVNARQVLSQWFESKRNAARSEIQTALGSLQLLQNLLTKKEVSELSDSVRESCKYRKTKVTALLGELQGVSHKLVDTDLDVECGELYLDLVKLNSQLQAAISSYQRLKDGSVDSLTADGAGMDAAIASHVAVTRGVDGNNSPGSSSPWTNISKPSHSASSGSKGVELDDAGGESAFTAELPWEDEDED